MHTSCARFHLCLPRVLPFVSVCENVHHSEIYTTNLNKKLSSSSQICLALSEDE